MSGRRTTKDVDMSDGTVFTVDAADMRAAISACSLAISDPKDRPNLSEVWAERMPGDKIRFIGTDGYRVHIVTVDGKWAASDRTTIRFPRDACRLIPGVLSRALAALSDTSTHGDDRRITQVSTTGIDLPGGAGLSFSPSSHGGEVPAIDNVLKGLADDCGPCAPMNHKYFADVGAASKRVTEGRSDALSVIVGADAFAPVSFRMSTMHRNLLAVVMPMRVEMPA